jgi:hypothetical protein
MEDVKGGGWIFFAGTMMLIAGVLNGIWGFAAIDGANFFIEDERYVLGDLNAMGWIIVVIALIQLVAAFSIWAGGEFGRWIGIFAASISAIGALLSIPGFPLWSVCVFFVDVLIIYGLAAYGGQARHPRGGGQTPAH